MADPFQLPPPLTIPEPVVSITPNNYTPTYNHLFFQNDKEQHRRTGRPLSLESLPSAVPFLQLLYLQDADPPPDGGYGYVVVLASFLCNFILFGELSSWGLWQTFKWTGTDLAKPWQQDAMWSLVGASAFACLLCGGLLVGRPIRKLGRRTSMFIGTCIASGGLVLASYATQVWQVVLTQGVLFGTGASLVFYSTLPLVTQWFLLKRRVVVLVCMLGSGLGVLTIAPLTWMALSRYGRSTTLLIFAGVTFVGFSITTALVKPWKKQTTNSVSLVTGVVDVLREGSLAKGMMSIARSNKFRAVWLHTTFNTAVYATVLIYLPLYAMSIGYTPLQAAFLLGCVAIVDGMARMSVPILATHYAWDKLATLLVLLAAASVSCVVWVLSSGNVVLFGMASSVVMFTVAASLSLTCGIATHLVDYDQIPDILCAVYTSQAIGSIVGPVLFGLTLDAIVKEKRRFMTAQFLLQVFIVSSIVCVFALQVMRKKGVLRRMRQAMSVFVPVEKSETV